MSKLENETKFKGSVATLNKTLNEQYIKMRAGQFFGKGDIRVVDVPEPKPGLGEAIVDVEWCGICGSDLHE